MRATTWRSGGCCGRPRDKTIGEVVSCAGPLYERLARPLFVAALNTEPKEGSAALAGSIIRETLAAGGKACRPLIARDGLGRTFVEPALRFLGEHNAAVDFGHRLRACDFVGDKVAALDFGDGDKVALGEGDAVILTVPPVVATDIVPGLHAPSEFRAIVNGHFRVDPPLSLAPIIGVVNGTVEWLFAFPGRLSVTISAGDRLLDVPRETLAQDDLAGGRDHCRPSARRCRRGRSCASAAPPSLRRRRRMPCGPAPPPRGAICFSPAIGPIRNCRRPSKGRSGPATGAAYGD